MENDTTQKLPKLLPCPFCGSEITIVPARFAGHSILRCPSVAKCGVDDTLSVQIRNDRLAEGIEAWNRRAAVLARQPVSPAMGELTTEETNVLARVLATSPHWKYGYAADSTLHMVGELVESLFSLRPTAPITQGTQLTEEETEALKKEAANIYINSEGFSTAFAKLVPMLLERLSARLSVPATPEYHVTAERPPTEADGGIVGTVECAKYGWQRWDRLQWNSMHICSYDVWRPEILPPVPPVSEEDAAFEAFFPTVTNYYTTGDGKVAARKVFDAARAYFESKKDSGK